MTDSTKFRVLPVDYTMQHRMITGAIENGRVVRKLKDGSIRFHALTEGTITPVNTGAATDTLITVSSTSLFSFQKSALFNATLQNSDKEQQILIGILFCLDHTTTSPDTDAGTTKFWIGLFHRVGTAPSYSASMLGIDWFSFTSELIVSGEVAAVPYSPYFIYPFSEPIICNRGDQETIYIGQVTMLARCTMASNVLVAHTAVTTYTLKMTAYAVLFDPELASKFNRVSDIVNFLKGELVA